MRWDKSSDINNIYFYQKSNMSHFEQGIQKISSENYEEAIEYLSKAIEENPGHVQAYRERGNAYGELNKHQEAIKDYS